MLIGCDLRLVELAPVLPLIDYKIHNKPDANASGLLCILCRREDLKLTVSVHLLAILIH